MKKGYSLNIGLDVGSTTAKIVVFDENHNLVYSQYKRHNAKVGEIVRSYLEDLISKFGSDAKASISVTGSVGMAVAQQLEADFLQEVVAATVYTRHDHPEAKILIDIGGEDAKVVFFNGKNTELRMNGNCAGGTGAFIDQMSMLMGVSNKELSDLAMRSTQVYPIAARCGVFAKTDIQNLIARNIPREDIAASIFHCIAVQTVTTLSHGCDYTAPILLCGGPLTFLPALRKAFGDYLNMEPDNDFIVSDRSNLIPAMGCAINAASKEQTTMADMLQKLNTSVKLVRKDTLEPLFKSDADYADWKRKKNVFAMPTAQFNGSHEDLFIGVDSGSTTTKIVASRRDGTVVFTYYAMNLGNPIQAVQKGLHKLAEDAAAAHTDLNIIGSCSTGYGEELIKAAFSLDEGIIETMAHYQAAERLEPDVSFILDIGGQDMKAIFVDHGVVVRMELNEACSSGCGTFLQTFAESLGYKIEDFARLACTASHPSDLGTRCTVFMNSKVKQVVREGATVADISAGLSYSVIKNCLYKVLKLHTADELGKKIVVQGGTMRNDAVVRAFELLSGTEVARSDRPELMGAYGCALHAIAAWSTAKPRKLGELMDSAQYETKLLQCRGCSNQCRVCRYTFSGGRKFFSGNKCERVFNNKGKSDVIGTDIYPKKYHLLFDRKGVENGSMTIGIPRALGMYEDYPFWHSLLTACGFTVVLSSESNYHNYEGALNSVMSDNICFPAKLIHSHIKELDAKGVDRILYPYTVFEVRDGNMGDKSFNCPIVTAYADVLRSSMKLQVPLDSPVINFSNEKLLRKQILAYLKTLGVGRQKAEVAFRRALADRNVFESQVRKTCEDILAEARRNNRLTILLAGRPYHTDPMVQHKLSEMIASLGVNVISDDIVRGSESDQRDQTHLVEQWAYANRIIRSAEWAAKEGEDVHFVEMTSFGCGPDAFIQDEVRDIMQRHGKPFTLLKIDDVANIGSLKLRVRSLIESLRMKNERGPQADFQTTRVFRNPDRGRKILAPFFTEFLSPLLPPLMKLAGYDVEILPPSDSESAQLGLKYANNEVCYPATLIVGDMVKALRSGKYDLKNTALVMTQTGGQCRATNYTALIKRAMIANGCGDVPLITLGVSTHASGGNEQEGFEIPWKKMMKIAMATLLYSDAIAKFYYGAAPREKVPGEAERLKQKYLRLAMDPIEHNDHKALVSLTAQAAEEFDSIVEDRECPKVGVVGEIFLKFNPFSHQFLVNRLVKKGIEVVPPLITPFFFQEFVNVEAKKELCLSDTKTPKFVIHALYKLVLNAQDKFNKAGRAFRYFRPFTNIYTNARRTKGIISLAAQFGEGWLLPSDVAEFVSEGVNNVVSLQPFGCIANHIISKGIEKKLHDIFPDLNMLSLDFDSGVSEVNVTNRLLLFLDNLSA